MEAGALSRIIRYFPPGALFRTNTSRRDLSIEAIVRRLNRAPDVPPEPHESLLPE